MRHNKIWEMENDDSLDTTYFDDIIPPAGPKNPAYKKPERSKASFVQE